MTEHRSQADFNAEFQALVARYLDGNLPLEPTATEFAHLWARWAKRMSPPTSPLEHPTAEPSLARISVYVDLRPGLTGQEAMRLQDLLDTAATKLSSIDNGAA